MAAAQISMVLIQKDGVPRKLKKSFSLENLARGQAISQMCPALGL